jgi:hypothetical protein
MIVRFNDVNPAQVHRGGRKMGSLLVMIATLLLVAGCSTHVDAFVPTDEHLFTIFGVLNPAADTQYVRVKALADSSRLGSARDLDAVASLVHLASGRVIVLRDSFMRVGDRTRDVHVHNFWTTEPIEPGATYRLTVERSDGLASRATATVPDAPPVITFSNTFRIPCVQRPELANVFNVVLRGAAKIAALDVLYMIDGEAHRFSQFDNLSNQPGEIHGYVNYLNDLSWLSPDPRNQLCAHPTHALIAASAAGPEWPDFVSATTLDELAVPHMYSNVENGHGLFGGIYSDTVVVHVRPRVDSGP